MYPLFVEPAHQAVAMEYMPAVRNPHLLALINRLQADHAVLLSKSILFVEMVDGILRLTRRTLRN